ncbi:hypothetical protein [Burkholderia anthina]|uniref:hypothetical protein n=1 Tax=Burkholderia anthina TaxID=179879 RepID=UPI00158B4C52
MGLSEPGKAKGSRVSAGAQAVLRVLENKPFYEHRFLGQIRALYGFPGSGVTDVTASLYLDAMFKRIPDELHSTVGAHASALIVNTSDGCPVPSEVRAIVAEATLAALGVTHAGLIERAKLFFSCPPTSQTIADRWIERVIYTTVRRMGRDRFAVVQMDEWKREISETIFGDGSALQTYQVSVQVPLAIVKRDFRTLVAQHG